MMTHIERATELFGKKFHCSQAVFAAFAEELGITEEQALKIAKEVYEKAYETMPRVGYTVKTPDGNGLVIEVNVPTETVRVSLETKHGTDIRSYASKDVKTIKKNVSEENNSELNAIADKE